MLLLPLVVGFAPQSVLATESKRQITFEAGATKTLALRGRTPQFAFGALGWAADGSTGGRLQVQQLRVAGSGFGPGVEAFEVSPSGSGVRFRPQVRPAASEEYRLYRVRPSGTGEIAFEGGSLQLVARIPAKGARIGKATPVPTFSLAGDSKPVRFVLAPKRSGLWSVGSIGKVAGEVVAQTPLGPVVDYVFPAAGDVRENSWLVGFLGHERPPQAYSFVQADGALALVDGTSLQVTRYGRDGSRESFRLPVSNGVLSSLASLPDGGFLYFTHAKGREPRANLVRVSRSGSVVANAIMNPAEFDLLSLEGTTSSLGGAERALFLTSSRTMHSGHQGSFAAIFDPQTLTLLKNYGQSCSHSFANRVILDDGFFVSADLGDNYPRGIILTKFARDQKEGRVAFTYRTMHEPRDERNRKGADGQPLVAGRWSNDNNVYTQLGDLANSPSGYCLLFSSEKSTENALTLRTHNQSRNLGMVLVRRQLDRVRQTEIIVPRDLILTAGEDSPEFGFFDYGGRFKRQKNTGVVWLTNYENLQAENAAYPRLVRVGADRYLALWERWSSQKYRDTRALLINSMGDKLRPEMNLGTQVRLNADSFPVLDDNRIYWASRMGRSIHLFVWDADLSAK